MLAENSERVPVIELADDFIATELSELLDLELKVPKLCELVLSGAEPEEMLDRLRLLKLPPETDDHDLELRELIEPDELELSSLLALERCDWPPVINDSVVTELEELWLPRE